MTAGEYKKWNKKYNEEFDDILCFGIGILHFSKDYPVEFLKIKRKEQEELKSECLNFMRKMKK